MNNLITLFVALILLLHLSSYHSFKLSITKISLSLKRTRVLFSTPTPQLTPLVANGKRVEAIPGSSMMQACQKLGLKVKTDCRTGDCGTCTVTVGGNKIRACIGKVPPAPRLKSLIEKGLVVSIDNK